MKAVPEKLNFAPQMFLDFAEGGYAQGYVNREYGIRVTVSRQTRHAPITRVITIQCLPGQEFRTIDELNEGLRKAGKIDEGN